MVFDFSAVELFLDFLAGKQPVEKLFDHPAYRIVRQHARMFSSGLKAADLQSAREGLPSNFYGLEHLAENAPRIEGFLKLLQGKQVAWAELVQDALQTFFIREDLEIPIYPILGYDKGIGLSGAACLNINYASYLDEPFEFLAYAIHECVHVVFERAHRIPRLAQVLAPAQWRSYFNLWTQNEGYATYVPLEFRQEHHLLDEADYRAILDPQQALADRTAYQEAIHWLAREVQATRNEYLETCFGSKRLTYRIGCQTIRRIEKSAGIEGARQAFYLDSDQFVARYARLLE
jgi:hypothetical protein